MTDFALDTRLAADTAFVADLALCRVLAMDDSRFPWLVLVPRIARASELFELDAQAQQNALEEISRCAAALKKLTQARKINIGALGNIVPQLHIHVVARMAADAAWPGPVWGAGQRTPYAPEAMNRFLADVRAALGIR
jgi:diadenosine tetraphosphate (Ap4A) HIT family hydrolase